MLGLLLVFVASTSAFAHPFGDRYAAQRLELMITADGARLGLTLDATPAQLRTYGLDPTRPTTLERLHEGVLLTVDGQAADWSAPQVEVREPEDGGHTVWVLGSARWPQAWEGPHRLHLENLHLAEQPGWYWNDLHLPLTVQHLETDLLTFDGQGKAYAQDAKWSRSPARRHLDVAFTLGTGPLSAASQWLYPDPVALGALPAPSFWTRWIHPLPTPEAVGAWLLAALTLGLTRPKGRGIAAATAALLAASAVPYLLPLALGAIVLLALPRPERLQNTPRWLPGLATVALLLRAVGVWW